MKAIGSDARQMQLADVPIEQVSASLQGFHAADRGALGLDSGAPRQLAQSQGHPSPERGKADR